MVVQHNLTAMNSNRMLGLTTKTQAKSTEKLSSGYKINRAADDAAGLSISEKMRKQIRGLTQASLNAQDGISSVQTAEGALTEVHDMLQRMNELAVKAANETNSESDRQSIQDEVDQLVTEIDRVSETTKFNEIYLLKGDSKNKLSVDYQYTDVTAPAMIGGKNLYTLADDGVTYNQITTDADLKTALDNKETIYGERITGGTAADMTMVTVDVVEELADSLPDATIGAQLTSWSKVAGETDKWELDITSLATGESFKIGNQTVTFSNNVSDTLDQITSDMIDDMIDDSNGTITAIEIQGNKIIVTGADVESYTANGAILDADGNEAFADGAAMTAADVAKIGTYYKTAPTVTKSEAVAGTDYTPAEKAALYDKEGNKVAANGLYEYFDKETGDYKGGLYTTDEGIKGGDATAVTKDTIDTYVDNTQMKEDGVLTFDLQVGADSAKGNQITVNLESMSAKSIGVENLKVDGADNTKAKDAIETVKAAIQQVSKQRSALGAVQNRLDHTINNLDNIVENTTAAESQIRDTDMATEMVKYSNNNILAQAGQAMLAQANQANQGVLGLLG